MFIGANIVHSQESADSSDMLLDNSTKVLVRNISVPGSVTAYYLGERIPYVDENTLPSEYSLPIVVYSDVSERHYEYNLGPFGLFPRQGKSTVASIKLIVWSDGTIVWRRGAQGDPYIDEYCLHKIDKEQIKKVTTEVTKKGEKYFSDQPRLIGIRFGTPDDGNMGIMLSNFYYRAHITPGMLEHYVRAKDFLKESSKEEKVAFIKKITGYVPHTMGRGDFLGRGNFLYKYKRLLSEHGQRVDDGDVLSDADINAIAPYVFDDLDFFVFCRDTFLSLIPPDNQGNETKVRFLDRKKDDAYLIVTEHHENGEFRYEYHAGSIDDFENRFGLLWERHTKTEKNRNAIP